MIYCDTEARDTEKIKSIIVNYAVLYSFIQSLLLAWFVLVAWLKGTWEVTIQFNHFGEGMIELFLLPALSALLFLAVWWRMKGY